MAMKDYESYKDTDQFWLKQIPSHWDIHKIKYVFNERSEKGHPEEPLLVSSQNMGVVPKSVYGNRTVEAMKGLDTLKLVKVGDFVISLRSFQGGIEYAYYQGIISPAYTIMILKGHVTPEYFRHLAKSDAFIKLLKLCVTGIREGQNINYTLLRNYRIPVPPKEEQDQIVRYLDWQNSRLNKLINAKKKEIALLEEQKQALISQAVTKGLDPHAPLKDSGIDWIGQIPEHWEIKTINNMFTLNEARNRDMKIIDAYQFKFGEIVQKPKLKLTKDLMHTYQDYTIIEPNDIVFNGLNLNYDFVTQRIGIAKNLGIITSSYISIKPRKDINPCFYAYMLKSYDSKKVFNGMGTGIRLTISWKQLKQLRILVPPKSEQQNIVQYLNELTDNFSQLINNTEKQVSLLQEYRTRLVADVVTGQIDVRNIAIPNYETVTETIDQPETAEESAISAEDQ